MWPKNLPSGNSGRAPRGAGSEVWGGGEADVCGPHVNGAIIKDKKKSAAKKILIVYNNDNVKNIF
jgi:hypothetical protein